MSKIKCTIKPSKVNVLSHQRSPASIVLLVGVGALVQQLLHSLHISLQDQDETQSQNCNPLSRSHQTKALIPERRHPRIYQS